MAILYQRIFRRGEKGSTLIRQDANGAKKRNLSIPFSGNRGNGILGEEAGFRRIQ
jgi:hypothetical protein